MLRGVPFKSKVAAKSSCHVAFLTTWPPRNCGIAEFSKSFVQGLFKTPLFTDNCSIEIIALSISDAEEYRNDPLVTPLIIDRTSPSAAFYDLAKYLNEGDRFTHLIIQQEFGITWCMWQFFDLVRWLKQSIQIITVVHAPLAYPTIEEKDLVYRLSLFSHKMVVMNWYGFHSLKHVYGVDSNKVYFIPHGVSLQISEEAHNEEFFSTIQPDDFIIFSNGLLHIHKGIERVLRILPAIVAKFKNVRFFIVGRENAHFENYGMMSRFFKKARALGVADHIKWINAFVPRAELFKMFKRADLYVTMFNEVTPTSGTLLTAMSFGLPIISTPYRFAVEVLGSDRGVIVPFENDAETLASFLSLIANAEKRAEIGRKAFEFAKNWSWERVAEETSKLLLTQNNFIPLTADPFTEDSLVATDAAWTASGVKGFNGVLSGASRNRTFKPMKVYTIFSNFCLQINAQIDESFKIVALGVKSHFRYYLITPISIDYENIYNSIPVIEKEEKWQVDLNSRKLVFQNEQIEFEAQARNGSIEIQFKRVSKFGAPCGIFGKSLQCKFDLFMQTMPFCQNLSFDSLDWSEWREGHDFLFGSQSRGQMYHKFGIEMNTFIDPKKQYLPTIFAHEYPKLPNFVIEGTLELTLIGPLFNTESFAVVNRSFWLSIMHSPQLNCVLKPSDSAPKQSDLFSSLSLYLIWHTYQKQYYDSWIPFHGPSLSVDVLFRNSWPPIFGGVPEDAIYIHQQPWELVATPKSWIEPLSKSSEIWVPSSFCRDSFIENGLSPSQIFVIPHAVHFDKFATPINFSPSIMQDHVDKIIGDWSSSFKFLFVGGLLPRKGIDILLEAFKQAFTEEDDVLLIVHSIYGDDYALSKLKSMSVDAKKGKELISTPVLHIDKPFSEVEMIKLFQSCDTYVSPFRCEGFGLTILEAMAAKLAPIITSYGPALEFVPKDSAYFVEGAIQDCFVKPCGVLKVFGESTLIQPRWMEPSISSLSQAMRKAYEQQVTRSKIAANAQQAASLKTWDKVGKMAIDRVMSLLKNKNKK